MPTSESTRLAALFEAVSETREADIVEVVIVGDED
jgi:hypothetical protein